MASGSWTFSTANQYITGRVRWSSTSTGSSANTSSVTAYLDYMKSSSSTAATYGTFSGSISINGSSGSISKSLTLNPNNSWVNVGKRTVTVSHNSDGTKSITIAVSGGINGTTFSSSSSSKSVILDKIARYAAINSFAVDNSSIDFTSAKFSWETDSTCDQIQYSLNGADYVTASTTAATSGSFTVSGLNPGTNYSIKLKVRRKDSQLSKESSSVSFTTKAIATISNSSVDFTIGNDLTITFTNYSNNKSFLKLEVQKTDGTYEEVIKTDEVIQAASYTWGLSSNASTLYAKVPTRNSATIRITCGTTINSTVYSNSITGTMSVSNSNPTFSIFTFGNADTTTNNLLGNTAYIPEKYGDMQAHISTDNKATAKNSATISKYVATIVNSSGQTIQTIEQNYSSNAQVDFDFGSFSTADTYKIKIYALDSRGNKSSVISNSFTVLSYHAPIVILDLTRQNGYESNTSISLQIVYSKLSVSSTVKNTIKTIKYRYAEAGTSYGSTYTSITVPSASSYSTNENTVLYTNDSFVDLQDESRKTFNFQFVISDGISSYQTTSTINQGIPIMAMMDNGMVSIGRIPDWDSTANLQVNSDILVTDANDNDRYIIEEIDGIKGGRNLVTDGDVEQSKTRNTSVVNVYYTVSPYMKTLNDVSYVVSFDAKKSSADDTVKIDAYVRTSSTMQNQTKAFELTTEYQRYYGVTTLKDGTVPSDITHVYIRASAGSGTFYVKNVKLERGSRNSDFTPAPEDVDNKINELDNKITSQTVNVSSVNNMRFAVGTKVLTATAGTSIKVFSISELNELFGVSDCSATNTTCYFANGDGRAQSVHVDGATYLNNAWNAVFSDKANVGNFRINYTVIYFGNTSAIATTNLSDGDGVNY